MSISIAPGGQISKDPSDQRVLRFDWDGFLAVGAELDDAGVFTVTAVSPRESPATLEVDQDSIEAGNRSVIFRLVGGRRGTLYNVAHAVATNETPAQRLERSFFVMVEDR
jgi:hypothetical protein